MRVIRLLRAMFSAARNKQDFDELSYLIRYPDVLAALRKGDIRSGYEHWLRQGRHAGRSAAREHWPPPSSFSEERYLRLNPDVEAAVRNGGIPSGLDHWTRYGRHENRPGAELSWTSALQPEVDMTRPAGATFFGFHSAMRGLSVAARGYVAALRAAGLPVMPVDLPLWHTVNHDFGAWEESSPPYRINVIQQNADMMPLWERRYGCVVRPGRYNIGIWLWELHAGYAFMHSVSRMLHEIWVPSLFVADAIRPVSAVPVYQIPPVVEGPAGTQRFARDYFGIPENAWVFLYVFDLSSGFGRKNPLALLHAFRQAFRPEDNTVLVLKYSQAGHDTRGAELLETLARSVPHVILLGKTMTEDEMASLYQVADCFVSPHRAEGFGLSVAHATYFDKPVIATGYSATQDLMSPEDTYVLNFRLIPVGPENDPYAADYVWADPDVDHLAHLLRHVWLNQEEARERGRRAGARVRAAFSTERVAELIRKRLQASGAVPEFGSC